MRKNLTLSLIVLCSLMFATTLSAQATRTWVSGVGDDVNPCSRTAPCKTFAGAISKTATCGEIDVLDPGGFGAVTITKSMTINGAGTMGSILNGGVTGVLISLSQNDFCNTVILRNLSINGVIAGAFSTNGIRIIGGFATNVHIEHVDIAHVQRGVDIQPTVSNFRIFMKDVDIRHTSVEGIDVRPSAGQQVRLSFDRVRSEQSVGNGLRLANDVRGTISNSHFQANANGVNVLANTVIVTLAETVISQNTGTGLINGSTATTLIDGCTITNNATGILNNTGGTVFGFANNMISGNATDLTGTAVQTAAHP